METRLVRNVLFTRWGFARIRTMILYVTVSGTLGCSMLVGPGSNHTSVDVVATASSLRTGSTTKLSVTNGAVPVTGGGWTVVGGSANGTVEVDGTYHAPTSVP